MTVGFSTVWPDKMGELAGQPNYFVHKTLLGLSRNSDDYLTYHRYMHHYLERGGEPVDLIELQLLPKLHTIRKDPNGRWRPGMKIHPVINNRTKDRFQFAPVLECTGIQEIEMHYPQGISRGLYMYVMVDGRQLNRSEIETLAVNDGFPSVEAFFDWFSEDFKGKIIQWTSLSY